ncbi:hypothetical protein GCM10010913_45070 [Paenibacillus aceti]|uniref:Uncharacterized protein n=1 Tax=Paenibacillus aceti TaxID=1820010 RepID=A0ABQ1W7E7_9BACL|nr:hypothetical protein [Paenibacillus aceti]GGG17944.1 hypothetical protein GCM10010913_45070 [Paenibacillus aceti]
MFNLFKGKNGKNVDVAVGNFLQEEKKRHKRAVDFLQLMAGVTAHVATEVWGMADQDVQVSDTVRFDLATQSFFFKGAESDINVQALKGQPFWQSVQQIMYFGQELLDDIKEREEGRKQIVSSISDLTEKIMQVQLS